MVRFDFGLGDFVLRLRSSVAVIFPLPLTPDLLRLSWSDRGRDNSADAIGHGLSSAIHALESSIDDDAHQS
jgi:hypothetical protein